MTFINFKNLVVSGSDLEKYSTKSVSEKFGQCQTFKMEVLLKTGESIVMHLEGGPLASWGIWVAFHELDDLPVETYPYFWIKKSEADIYYIKLRKKIIATESTRKSPCGNQYPEVCKEIENIKMVQEKFKCQSLLFNSGPHLENNIDKTLPNCSLQQIREAFALMKEQNISLKCQDVAKCERVRYEIASKTPNTVPWAREGGPMINLRYQDTEVEKHWNYVSYNIFNLIGEIGGYLGLTLGLSGVSIT